MKILVWQGCVVETEIDLPGAPGPDISIDPWGDLIGAGGQFPVPYRENGVATGKEEL